MASESTTRWPLLDERAPLAGRPRRAGVRRLPRSSWLLIALAFLCGGLVSAAGFSIGWRHQAQHDNATQAALATATARARRLSASLATTRQTIARAREAEARAVASARAASRGAASLAADAGAAGRAAAGVSSGASTIATTAARVTRELQTLLTYLTTTPTGQIDSGYVASQATYLARQLTTLHDTGGSIASAVASFDQAVRKLSRSAAALSPHH
jgi:hypothetical protein